MIDDDKPLCLYCSGSGEGYVDGSRCIRCHGQGVEWRPEEDDRDWDDLF